MMSRRKQPRPKHYATTSEDEEDEQIELNKINGNINIDIDNDKIGNNKDINNIIIDSDNPQQQSEQQPHDADIIGHSKTSNDNNNIVAIKDKQSQILEINDQHHSQPQLQQQLHSVDTLLEGNQLNKHNNNNNHHHQNRKHNQDKGHHHHNIDKNIDDFIEETTNNENFDSVNLKRFKKDKSAANLPLVVLDTHDSTNDNHNDNGNGEDLNLIKDSKITSTNDCKLMNIHSSKQQRIDGDSVENKLISPDYHHLKRSSIDFITRESITAFEQNVRQESIDNGQNGNSCWRKNSLETNGHHHHNHQSNHTPTKTSTNPSTTINHYSPASMFDVKFKSYHNSKNNNNNNQDNLFVSTSLNNNIGKNNFSHFINCSPNNNNNNSFNSSTILNVPLMSKTMKSHITPNGKNLCDKCGGSYATLAALISHKKSCKSKKKLSTTSTTNTTSRTISDHHGSSSSSSVSRNHISNNNNNTGDDKLLSNNSGVHDSDPTSFFQHHHSHSHPHLLSHHTYPLLQHQHQSLSDEHQQNLNKLMAFESLAAAAAAVAMENSSTVNQQQATSPLSALSGHWPTTNEMMMNSPISQATTTTAPSFSAATSDMNAFIESLTPLFTGGSIPSSSTQHQPSERNESLSAREQQQQAALFTQQMMLFHMLQQMHQLQQQQHPGTSSSIPPFPLIAAAAAAAAQHQSSQQSTLPPSLSSSPLIANNNRSISLDQLNDNEIEGKKSPVHHYHHNLKHISRTSSSTNQNSIKKDTHIESSSTTIKSNKTKILSFDHEHDEEKSDLEDGTHRQCQPSSSLSPKSDRENESITNSASTRKLLSSILDLKDTNPDAPLPPMMSPPKVDSSEPVSFSEPNTLELLQKHTEQALQNTMSGGSFLLNGLSSTDNNELLNFRKGKDGKEDPANRHRCKFCGKVFGSDSALQIHIRSHTGERPFKCNVCGNRFTTKGNLKVHFQRHKAKYPHVKMNPHPVPEHLDKFHPPLEPPSNSQSPPPPPPPTTSSSSSYPSQSNTLHIPAIFSSTLIPYANDEAINNKSSNNSDKNKSKPKSLFDFANFYKNNKESGVNEIDDDNDNEDDEDDDDDDHNNDNDDIDDDDNVDDDDVDDDDDAGDNNNDNDVNDSIKSDHSDISSHHTDQEKQEEQSKQNKKNQKCKSDKTTFYSSDTDLDTDDCDSQRRKPSSEQDKNRKQKNKDHENENNEYNNQDNHNEPNNDSIKKENESNRDENMDQQNEIDDLDDIDADDDIDDVDGVDEDDDDELCDEFGIPYGLISSKHSLHGLMGLPFNMDANGFSNSVSLPASLAANNSSAAQFPRISDSMSESDLVEGASKDPVLYQNLLPKPGSTDSAWETLMEVQKASETVKLQQLVDNIEHKLQDPNQCIICQRVLSCKSALQMHYRTHTGERPFKCKICGRAFTTKGNLKTHMGVHRVKPPLRMLHQCPICHKQFTNALVLQQHIRLHSIDPNGSNTPDITPEMLNDLKNSNMNFPRSFFPMGFNGPFPALPPGAAPGLFSPNFLSEMAAKHLNQNSNSLPINILNPSNFHQNQSNECSSVDLAEKDNDLDTTDSDTSKDKRKSDMDIDDNRPNKVSTSADDIRSISDTTEIEEELLVSPIKKKKIDDETKKNEENTLSALEHHVMKSTAEISPQPRYQSSKNENEIASNSTPKTDINNEQPSKADNDRSKPYPNTPFAGLPYHPTGRPNTTCRICLKTFACFSALEIHYRSHTKERPFKCEVCDRGFSTKGNMKQHMLTHKIRDLPQELYSTISPSDNTTLGNFLTSNSITKIIGKQMNFQHHQNNMATSSNNSNSSSRVASPHTPNENSMDSDKFRNTESPATESSNNTTPHSSSSSSNKHMCNICNKPFSSGSALQIHMRTHTGDKPFKCQVCGRAFTTKGNLKVHMGTHIYTHSNPSRRGRRMSIDLPNLKLCENIIQNNSSAMSEQYRKKSTTEIQSSQPLVSTATVPTTPPTPTTATLPATEMSDSGNHPNPDPDLFLRFLNPHFLNTAANSEASQLALQQMMLMKMMSSQHHQQQQRSPSSQIPLELTETSDKTPLNHNDKNIEDDNENQSFIGNESKELICEPEIDLNNDKNCGINNSTSNQHSDDDDDDDEVEKAYDEDEMENHSFRSDRSHQANDDWSNKLLKCTLCSQVCHSPTDFEEHIKAHLHAAAAAANSMSASIKTTADVAS